MAALLRLPSLVGDLAGGVITVICEKCGNQIDGSGAFCPSCGSPIDQERIGAESKRRERFDGVVRKCPNCGETLGAFVAVCPSCGTELRGLDTSSRVKELEEKLGRASSAEERSDLIKSFYIPNTREDIYEFFILAASNIEAGGEGVDAWLAKLDQAYKKALLVFGEGKELNQLKSSYEEVHKKYATNSAVTALRKSRAAQCAALFAAGVVLQIIGNIMISLPNRVGEPFRILITVGAFLIIAAIVLLFRLLRKR